MAPLSPETFQLFRAPKGERLALAIEPRLESWDVATHPSQTALRGYLDHVEALADPALQGIHGSAAVELSVGLPTGTPMTAGGRDLDNYLYPVVRRLGASRVAAAFAEKNRGSSTIRLAPAVPRPVEEFHGWGYFTATTTASAESRRWKEEIAAAVPTGPVGTAAIEMHLAFVVPPRRNWTTLWKPAIDALGGILGVENPGHPFRPCDDRIVRLGLHRTLDERVGWGVEVGVWWREITGTASSGEVPAAHSTASTVHPLSSRRTK